VEAARHLEQCSREGDGSNTTSNRKLGGTGGGNVVASRLGARGKSGNCPIGSSSNDAAVGRPGGLSNGNRSSDTVDHGSDEATVGRCVSNRHRSGNTVDNSSNSRAVRGRSNAASDVENWAAKGANDVAAVDQNTGHARVIAVGVAAVVPVGVALTSRWASRGSGLGRSGDGWDNDAETLENIAIAEQSTGLSGVVAVGVATLTESIGLASSRASSRCRRGRAGGRGDYDAESLEDIAITEKSTGLAGVIAVRVATLTESIGLASSRAGRGGWCRRSGRGGSRVRLGRHVTNGCQGRNEGEVLHFA